MTARPQPAALEFWKAPIDRAAHLVDRQAYFCACAQLAHVMKRRGC